ncbi:MAG: hypothetical protein ABJB16_03025, partial [Saprospiraceae bacterium]
RILHIPYKNHNQMEKTVLISLCSLFFLGFTLNSHTIQDQKKENTSTPTEIINVETILTDSIPSKGTYMIHKKTDSQDISIQVEDGDIKELHVDGKEIKPGDFSQYGEVIDELFGSIEAPPSAEGFNFMMPAMPPMPSMAPKPAMAPMPTMPPMPAMPPMPEMPSMPPMPAMGMMNAMELEQLFKDGAKDGNKMKIFQHGMNGQEFKFFGGDTIIMDGKNKIIIITDKDTSVITADEINWSSGNAPEMNFEYNLLQNSDEWKANQENWKQMQNEWKKNWEEKAQQWKEGSKEQQEKMEDEQSHMRAEGDRLREEGDQLRQEGDRVRGEGDRIREDSRGEMNSENYARALQDELLANGYGEARGYSPMARGMNMTDALIGEGLVQPGEEADILLTPDKLKINGKKMPENIHQKYLKMYEEQQGVQLSGNSRVEFKTKSRRSM